jgi:HSP20 family molecular chaperone IbpA
MHPQFYFPGNKNYSNRDYSNRDYSDRDHDQVNSKPLLFAFDLASSEKPSFDFSSLFKNSSTTTWKNPFDVRNNTKSKKSINRPPTSSRSILRAKRRQSSNDDQYVPQVVEPPFIKVNVYNNIASSFYTISAPLPGFDASNIHTSTLQTGPENYQLKITVQPGNNPTVDNLGMQVLKEYTTHAMTRTVDLVMKRNNNCLTTATFNNGLLVVKMTYCAPATYTEIPIQVLGNNANESKSAIPANMPLNQSNLSSSSSSSNQSSFPSSIAPIKFSFSQDAIQPSESKRSVF